MFNFLKKIFGINVNKTKNQDPESDDTDHFDSYEHYMRSFYFLPYFDNNLPIKMKFQDVENMEDYEKEFFVELQRRMIMSKLKGSLYIDNSSPTYYRYHVRFKSTEIDSDIGTVRMRPPIVRYAVIKEGAKRATKIFDTLEEAQSFSDAREKYHVEERSTKDEMFLIYINGRDEAYTVHLSNPYEAKKYIKFWIATIFKEIMDEEKYWK